MAFSVTLGSGVAIIPCGNTSGRAPYTRLAVVAVPARTRRKLQVARAANENAGNEKDEFDDYSRYEEFLRYRDGQRRLRRSLGENRKWVGYVMQYLWLIGFPVSVIVNLIGIITYHEPPKEFRERYDRLYTPQGSIVSQEDKSKSSSEVFEEPDAYESDFFYSNPTEVAPSLD